MGGVLHGHYSNTQKGEIDNMKIINKVTYESYVQWIEQFVEEVLRRAKLNYEEVVIEDIEHSRRISLIIDGKEYSLRTWSFHPVEEDSNGDTCAEMVQYTLYEMIPDKDGSHGEEVDFSLIRIEWKN